MLQYVKYSIIIGLIAFFVALLMPNKVTYTAPQVIEAKPTISHAQDTWIRALEWCESSGSPKAVNPEDSDGTPSFGAFQFKPTTFDFFKKKYGIDGEIMDRDIQYQIVSQMVLNQDKVHFDKQFPNCVKKLGLPPRF